MTCAGSYQPYQTLSASRVFLHMSHVCFGAERARGINGAGEVVIRGSDPGYGVYGVAFLLLRC